MPSSKYKGVSWSNAAQGWIAQYKANSKSHYIGVYKLEIDAAIARNVFVYLRDDFDDVKKSKYYNQLGKPTEEQVAYYQNYRGDAYLHHTKSCVYKGVSWSQARQAWHANIIENKKSIFLGRFNTSEEAAQAYNDAASKTRQQRKLNIIDTKNTYYPLHINKPCKKLKPCVEIPKQLATPPLCVFEIPKKDFEVPGKDFEAPSKDIDNEFEIEDDIRYTMADMRFDF